MPDTQGETLPAGAVSADFPVTPPKVAQPHWVLIQARYGKLLVRLGAGQLRVELDDDEFRHPETQSPRQLTDAELSEQVRHEPALVTARRGDR